MTDIPDDFNDVYIAYTARFGSCPYIGLDERQIYDLYIQMKQALAGERPGDIDESEFYGDLDDNQTI